MKKSILSLGGVAVLSNEEQKMVKGGTCGVKVDGFWVAAGTLAEAKDVAKEKGLRCCCASCPWNK